MFDALHTIIGPNLDPWPFPKHDWTMKEILIAAVLYLTFLILTRGVSAGTAFAAVTAGIVGAAIAYGLGDEADYDVYFEGYEEAKTKYATKEALEQEEREHEEMMEQIDAEMTEDEWGPAL